MYQLDDCSDSSEKIIDVWKKDIFLFLREGMISTHCWKKEWMGGRVEDDPEVSRLGNRVHGESLSERKKYMYKITVLVNVNNLL